MTKDDTMETSETTTVRIPAEAKDKLDELCRRHRPQCNKSGMLAYLIEEAHKALTQPDRVGDHAAADAAA